MYITFRTPSTQTLGSGGWYEIRDLRESPAATPWLTGYITEDNRLLGWIRDECIVTPNAKSLAAPLYASYGAWARRNGIEPMTQTAFGRKLGKHFRKMHTVLGSEYRGIAPKPRDGGEQ